MSRPSYARRAERAVATRLLNLPQAALRLMAGRPTVVEGQTLDVQIQLLLRIQRLRGEAALGGTTPEQERRSMDEQCQVLEPRNERPLSVEEFRVAGGDGAIAARLYRPDACTGNTPALIFYHGGGFVLGSLASHDGVCRALAERAGCVVIAVDYRLAPEHQAPAAAEDAIAAYRDIAARAEQLDIDAGHLAVSGDSAGGDLAAVVAQATRDDPHPPCFQLLFYPAVDYARDRESVRTFGKGYLLEKASMDWFRQHFLPASFDNTDPRVSPIRGDLQGVAPAVVYTGGFDPLRDEGEAYAEALSDAGVAAEARRQPGLIHGFVNIAGPIRAADAVLSESAATLAEHLHRSVARPRQAKQKTTG